MSLKQILMALALVSALFIALRVYMGGGGLDLWAVMAALSGQPSGPQPAQPLEAPQKESIEPALRILMAGNSYLARNDMASMVRQLAIAAGKPAPVVSALCPGGATLEDHLERGEVVARLADRPWDFLVLQEQSQRSSFAPAQRERQMYAPARALDAAAEAVGAQTVLFMTWARRDGDPSNVPGDRYAAMQKRVATAYLELGAKLQAPIAGVGFAWQKALARRPDIALWAADGSHPTRAGSYLAACVLYATLFDADPVGNSFRGGLSENEAGSLQRIASSVAAAL